jgi:hypothetical protein
MLARANNLVLFSSTMLQLCGLWLGLPFNETFWLRVVGLQIEPFVSGTQQLVLASTTSTQSLKYVHKPFFLVDFCF